MMECRGKKRENTGESRYKQPHQHSIDDMANATNGPPSGGASCNSWGGP
jgi:hypothetical protein